LCGYPVHYLISSDLNLKITDETDLLLARLIIERILLSEEEDE
jgi:2-C-methyl-D-erythritol 4-phosphate cytidylyltransferase